ncbi:hypothetical protein MCUN1_001655 [Malassezia cuniculi]|uniref:VTT domain-containing protein n=1 Tax=Malassezia cuniculi TaxID=948313 RepID=A0AAF0EUY4_9BASI|nr:hypothetical protein MCUN1_001655 [Malassezia cuniculi]
MPQSPEAGVPPRSRPLLRLLPQQYSRGRSTPDFTVVPREKEGISSADNQIHATEAPANRRISFRRILNGIVPAKRSERRDPSPPSGQLVMPSARRGAMVLDDSSSTYLSDDESVTPPTRSPYVAPRHAWSVAQAHADASAAALHNGFPAPIPSPSISLISADPSLASSSEPDQQGYCSPLVSFRTLMRRWFWSSKSYPHNVRADIDAHSTLATLMPHVWKFVFLGCTFVSATVFLGYLLSTLPLHLPTHLAELTLAEIRDMCVGLQQYASRDSSSMWHVFVVLSVLFVWKQAFCVPGSIIMNIIFGAMYGAYRGTLFASIYTAFGGLLCYLLAAPFAEVAAGVPGIAKPLHSMRVALADNGAVPKAHEHGKAHVGRNLWSYLMVLRLLPIVPYGMMNIACGVLGVPIVPFTVTLGLGSVPWNFCTTQLGEILQDVVTAVQSSMAASAAVAHGAKEAAAAASVSPATSMLASDTFTILLDRLCTPAMLVKLLLLSVMSALPLVLNRYLKRDSSNTDDTNDEAGMSMADAHVTASSSAPSHRLASVMISA